MKTGQRARSVAYSTVWASSLSVPEIPVSLAFLGCEQIFSKIFGGYPVFVLPPLLKSWAQNEK
jgi:hypothetical protein